MKIAFVTNICSHYRVKTFEILARDLEVDYYFFSAGNEWYWQQQHGNRIGNFRYKYLSGIQIGNTRVTPSLPIELFKGKYDIVIKCINGRFALLATYLITRLFRKPFVLWTGIWMRLNTPVHSLFFPITRYIYRNSDAVVVYGEHVKKYLISEGVSPECIFIAPHAVDNEPYRKQIPEESKNKLRKQLGIGLSQKVILYLGRLESVKGLQYLIEAFSMINQPKALLLLAGTGSSRSSLEILVSKYRLKDKVLFSGYVQPEEAVLYYSIADLFVLPSITMPQGKETWGLVVNEAFNQGLPVIATDSVGAAAGGLIRNGENGLIIPERDSAALAEAIISLLTNDRLKETMGENASRIVANWDNEKMVQGFKDAINYALSSWLDKRKSPDTPSD